MIQFDDHRNHMFQSGWGNNRQLETDSEVTGGSGGSGRWHVICWSWKIACFFFCETKEVLLPTRVCVLPWGIQSPSANGNGTKKYYAFRRWLDTPMIIWEYDWMPRDECPFFGGAFTTSRFLTLKRMGSIHLFLVMTSNEKAMGV